MNLFFLDEDPIIAATLYCDQHLGKIRLEASQMLSTAYHLSEHVTVEEKDGLCYVQKHFIYKKAFVNHPTCVWVRSSKGNFDWTLEHLKALQTIWENRGNNGSLTGLVITALTKHILFYGCHQA